MNSLARRLERLESQQDCNLVTRHDIDTVAAYTHRTLCQLSEGAEPPIKRPPDYEMAGTPHDYGISADVESACKSLYEDIL